MKKVYLDITYIGYPKNNIYRLAYSLGRELINYLGEDIFKLLLISHCMLYQGAKSQFLYIDDYSYIIYPSAKALEGFLKKLIDRKKLKISARDEIGDVFGAQSAIARSKLKNKKLVSKTKYTWEFCRNDVMHYPPSLPVTIYNVYHKYDDIIETIKYLYEDLYGPSKSDEEITINLKRYNK